MDAVVPASLPTRGGRLAIFGYNFGASLTNVTVAGMLCDVVESNHTHSLCDLPEGTGAGLEVVLRTGREQRRSEQDGRFSFFPPVLIGASPSNETIASRGGQLLTLTGENFGAAPRDAIVALGGRICDLLRIEHELIVCRLPPGAGRGLGLEISVGGQRISPTDALFNVRRQRSG